MHPIVPHLWFDHQAKEAIDLYCSLIPDSYVTHSITLHDTPSGNAELFSFVLAGQPFMAINAGPYFQFNPSISFFLNFDPSRDRQAQAHLEHTWAALSEGGKVLMPLGEYPFSKCYGWIQDRYGLSWQLILSNPEGDPRPFVVPCLLFTRDRFGKAETALQFYLSVFQQVRVGQLVHYSDMDTNSPFAHAIAYADFQINETWMAIMDGPGDHAFAFNEAISFVVTCDTQAEIDAYWQHLSAVPEAEQCGWCKDSFGISWQITPSILDSMMKEGSPEQIKRVTQAFLKMKKFDIAALQKAYSMPE
ncbi:VOC family protein [Thermoflavifilum thermophilum]|nr:VOC family protein [Thermoflavifilum thermophilum]